MEETLYTVPDYYPRFACKMGACRHACCSGWPVSISLRDYYHLIGESCSPDLRRRIDCSLHLQENPTDDDYAFISPNYLGQCPMQLEDGRCTIQAELGENALTDVCRLYPRGVRTEGDLECSCANSCEGVIELFLAHPEPIAFIKVPLSIRGSESPTRSVFFETVGREQDIRLYFIRYLQNRAVSLPARLWALGHAMQETERLLEAKDAQGMDKLLASPLPAANEVVWQHSNGEFLSAIRLAEKLLSVIDRHSHSVHEYGVQALSYFGNDENSLARYVKARENLRSVLPDCDIAYEHMLVNHMFFERFPFQDRPESMHDEFAALCLIYIVLRFLTLGYTALHPNREAFVDACAAAFRFFDHTSFDRHAAPFLRETGISNHDEMLHLLLL